MPSWLNIHELTHLYIIPWGMQLLMALLIFIAGRKLAKLLLKLIQQMMEKAQVDAMLMRFAHSLLNGLFLLFIVIAAFSQLGVDTTSFIALLGAAGLAVGLALRDSLKDFASGILLLIFQPFKVGHTIETSGITGSVEEIGVFTTRLKTGDNREVTIPNGKIYSAMIINNSIRDTRRIDMVFGIEYSDDIQLAKAIMNDILANDARILKEPAALVAVVELADSSVNFNVRPWVNNADYWPVRYDVTEKIKLAFDAHGISIPFPQIALHVKSSS